MREVIETPDEYIDLIQNSRDPPFTMIDALQCEVKDFDTILQKNKEILQIKISSVVKIDYFPNGEIYVHYEYQGVPSKVFLKLPFTFDDMENAPLATGVGISSEKVKDLKHLQSFLSLKGQIFYEKFFNSTTVRLPKAVNVKTENLKKEKKEKEEKKERKERKKKKEKKEKKEKTENVKNKKKKLTKK